MRAALWQDAAYEKGETQSVYNDSFEVLCVRRCSVAGMKDRRRQSR